MLTNRRTITVEFGHCDPSGIVYNPNYLVWFDHSVHALLARGGLTLRAMMDEFGLDGIPLVESRIRFLAPARWGDELVIETGITHIRRSAFDIQHRVFNRDALAVESDETRVCTAMDRTAMRLRACPLPGRFIEIFAPSEAPK